MPVLLCRVDDRLIHGQVVLGWGRPLGLERIVLVDDDVAANTWEQQLYRMAVPAGMEVIFSGVGDAAARLAAWNTDPRAGALLTGDIDTMAALYHADRATVGSINLGGIHHRPGRTERLPYLYLSDDELTRLRALEREGLRVTAQDVPTAAPVALGAIR